MLFSLKKDGGHEEQVIIYIYIYSYKVNEPRRGSRPFIQLDLPPVSQVSSQLCHALDNTVLKFREWT